MPNTWEAAHGLNPNSNTDFKLDFDGDGYINLQEYLDEVGAFPAPSPLTYVGPASGPTARYALITNWKTNDLVEPLRARSAHRLRRHELAAVAVRRGTD